MNNSITKIIFVIEAPLDKRIFNILGIETMMSYGFEVEVWDVTPYFHKTFFKKITTDGPIVYNECKQFNNKRDIIRALSNISSNTIMNLHIALQFETFFIYHFLSTKNIKYCVQQMIYLPNSPTPEKCVSIEFFRSIIKRIIALKPKHVFFGLCDKILLNYFYWFNIRPADLALLSGERSFEAARDPISAKTHFIWSHVEDYDTYLTERNIKTTTDPHLGIFLDEYYPLHTDMDYLGISSPIGVEEYYSKLCTFFDHLEKTYNVRIVIAAHPRSNYSESPDYFGGRQTIKGQTARLVHESSFVLAHDSTSINFAILFRKPIIFITMDKIQKCDAGRLTTALSIKAMADSLKKNPINLDASIELNWQEELKIDLPAYENYLNDIIHKKGVPDIPSGEIFIQNIKKIYN